MKRSTHPEAYDWLIKCGDTPQEIEDMFDSLVIGIYNAHADLRAAGKLPASAMMESVEPIIGEYDPSLTPEVLEMLDVEDGPIPGRRRYTQGTERVVVLKDKGEIVTVVRL